MFQQKFRFYGDLRNFSRNIDLNVVTIDNSGGDDFLAQPAIFKKFDRDSPLLPDKPMLSLSREDAQALMDELWRCGLRPTEGSGSAGSLAATERHLKDMQRLVFKDSP